MKWKALKSVGLTKRRKFKMSNVNYRKSIFATFVCIIVVLLMALLIRFIVQRVYVNSLEITVIKLNNLFIYKYLALNLVNLTAFIMLYIFLGKKFGLKSPLRVVLPVVGYASCALIIRFYV
jgi:uncharacterized membrane-anchored protein YitT (DUF2179 family)